MRRADLLHSRNVDAPPLTDHLFFCAFVTRSIIIQRCVAVCERDPYKEQFWILSLYIPSPKLPQPWLAAPSSRTSLSLPWPSTTCRCSTASASTSPSPCAASSSWSSPTAARTASASPTATPPTSADCRPPPTPSRRAVSPSTRPTASTRPAPTPYGLSTRLRLRRPPLATRATAWRAWSPPPP
ncbi:hypothetical protein VTK73DRAFT_4238 [Phialemonium thermophilum]|uniref:Uncharacterized protein n=1 Tax=Phialemonium thermophilum TaxID=223376 RepID=A0ABR3VAI1_9PEZI